jgi:Arc/MetJ-type ribon-helix-helix transcriptional regulator
MTIHLPKYLERFVQDTVRAGRYARADDVIRDALIRLRQAMPGKAVPTRRSGKPARPRKPLTEAEFDQHLINLGLMNQLPDTEADFDDPDDQPIDIKGEPLSETVIRERR